MFEIAKTTGGYAGTPITLVSFNGTDGAYPYAFPSLIADANGDLFNTTYLGGASDAGTVFEITGSGFVPLKRFVGTPGTSSCHGISISTLADTYGGIAHAATSLGYANVPALQNAVTRYCGS